MPGKEGGDVALYSISLDQTVFLVSRIPTEESVTLVPVKREK